jgi:RND superfamily putative drug exporter
MFAWWGRAVVRLRWFVLAAALGLVVLGATWGASVFGSLTGGGFDDPGSPSAIAHARIDAEIGRQDLDLIVLYTDPAHTIDDPAFAGPVRDIVTALKQRADVETVISYVDTPAPGLVSNDRHATYVAIQLKPGSADGKTAALADLRPALQPPSNDISTEVGGAIAFLHDADEQVKHDITKAEVISLPILLVLLVFIFRGLVAAVTPLVVGVIAILGALVATRIITGFTDVSVFAVNVITMLGLGMGIDYALFVVSRFREELAAGHDRAAAIERTMITAGRTVVVSGFTVALALGGLLLFPMVFLKSMGYGGMAAVLVAMVAALTALPALLAVLGPRINSLAWRWPARAAGKREPGAWARIATSVMRRPVLYLVGVLAVLFLMASPFLRAQFGGFDERVMPVGTESRTVSERLAAEFPGGGPAPLNVMVTGASPAQAQAMLATIKAMPGVSDATIQANKGNAYLYGVDVPGSFNAAPARNLVTEIRGLARPPGQEIFVSGRSAFILDQLNGLGGRLPWAALMVAGVTFLLLFFAFGSVVLPLKAIAMNVVSIGASFGVVVWAFQDGHLSGPLGFTSTGFLEPTNLILMLAVLFGLSTDYEVFLLSRVREDWDRTGDNTHAVANGLQRTGGIITAAALLLMIVIGGFATGGTATVKLLGVGTFVAVAVDAALVRTLLVPATMRLLGRWNWWAPGPLARVYRRYGIKEEASDQPPSAAVTRSAAPL